MAIRRGTNPTQIKYVRSYLGKAKKSKTPDKSGARITHINLKILDFNI